MTSVSPVIIAASLFAAALSILVVTQCYRGYARNESRPLLFLGLGIALVTLPSLLFSSIVVAFGVPPYVDLIILAQTLGLLSLLYAFTRA